jgi:UDP-2,3-diacylglucosamine pyrophosphatase LpxH
MAAIDASTGLFRVLATVQMNTWPGEAALKRNLLVVSDVHLGSDLVQHLRPETPERTPASVRRDEELCALLDWYRLRPLVDAPWRLVIAGDFIDFSGMCLRAAEYTGLSPDERTFGIGGRERDSVAKMRATSAAHPAVFSALARFIAAGNDVIVVRGNHDVDLFWPEVQHEFREAIALYTQGRGAELGERVSFRDWFYYEPGRVYIEHGHHYDEYCTHAFPLNPLDHHRGDCLTRSLSDALKRWIVNPTRGLTEAGHEDANMLDYLRLAARLKSGGCVRLVTRYLVTIARLAGHAWQGRGRLAAELGSRQDQRLREIADEHNVPANVLQTLARTWRRPGTHSLGALFACLMVDRILLATFFIGVASLLLRSLGATMPCGMALLTLFAWSCLVWIWLSQTRGPVDMRQPLRGAAGLIQSRLDAPLIVMGHTHFPEIIPLGADARYVNLGAWFESEPTAGLTASLASRTHLVVPHNEQSRATLYTWEHQSPREFDARKASQAGATDHAQPERARAPGLAPAL